MDDGYGREIDTMCNLSYMFEERGITKVALKLILMGKDNTFIRKATALSEEAIEKLRETAQPSAGRK